MADGSLIVDRIEVNFIYPFRIENWNRTRNILKDEITWALSKLRKLIVDDPKNGKKLCNDICMHIDSVIESGDTGLCNTKYPYINILLGKSYTRKYFSNKKNDINTLKRVYNVLKNDMQNYEFFFLKIILDNLITKSGIRYDYNPKTDEELLKDAIKKGKSDTETENIVLRLKKSAKLRIYEDSETTPHLRIPNPHIIMQISTNMDRNNVLVRKINMDSIEEIQINHVIKLFSSGYGILKLEILLSGKDIKKDNWKSEDVIKFINSIVGKDIDDFNEHDFVIERYCEKVINEFFKDWKLLNETDLIWNVRIY